MLTSPSRPIYSNRSYRTIRSDFLGALPRSGVFAAVEAPEGVSLCDARFSEREERLDFRGGVLRRGTLAKERHTHHVARFQSIRRRTYQAPFQKGTESSRARGTEWSKKRETFRGAPSQGVSGRVSALAAKRTGSPPGARARGLPRAPRRHSCRCSRAPPTRRRLLPGTLPRTSAAGCCSCTGWDSRYCNFNTCQVFKFLTVVDSFRPIISEWFSQRTVPLC